MGVSSFCIVTDKHAFDGNVKRNPGYIQLVEQILSTSQGFFLLSYTEDLSFLLKLMIVLFLNSYIWCQYKIINNAKVGLKQKKKMFGWIWKYVKKYYTYYKVDYNCEK